MEAALVTKRKNRANKNANVETCYFKPVSNEYNNLFNLKLE